MMKKFFDKINKSKNGCWNWTGCVMKSSRGNGDFVGNYGRIVIDGKHWLAHRLSFSIHNNVTLSDECVLHSCDNPLCVNPEHLFLGTRKENVTDMITKGRQRGSIKNINSAKLKEADVLNIRDMIKMGMDNISIASKFSVTKSSISHIRTGRTWRFVST